MDSYLQRQICARIKQARIEAGFTQQEIADLLNMTMRGYQNYESSRVPFRELDKIADLTGRSQEWFLRGDDEVTATTQPEVLARLDQLEASVESLRQEILAGLAALAKPQAAG